VAGLGRRENAGAGERGLLWTTARGSSTAWGAAELCGTEWALGGGGRATAAVSGGRSAPMPGPWPRSHRCRRGRPVDPLGRRRGTGRWGRRRRGRRVHPAAQDETGDVLVGTREKGEVLAELRGRGRRPEARWVRVCDGRRRLGSEMRKGIRVEESGARRGWSATVRSLVRPESWARRLDCGYRRWARRPGRGRCRRHVVMWTRSPRRERDAAARAAERYRQPAHGDGRRLPVLQRGLDRRLGERLAEVPERGTWGRKEEREEDEGRAQRGCNPLDRRCRATVADTPLNPTTVAEEGCGRGRSPCQLEGDDR
jgi:hypothetical protein